MTIKKLLDKTERRAVFVFELMLIVKLKQKYLNFKNIHPDFKKVITG
jgi:hypothetical protein